MQLLVDFLYDDAGAITIDWVSLTAGILLLGILTTYSIFNNGVSKLALDVASTVDSRVVSVQMPSIDPM